MAQLQGLRCASRKLSATVRVVLTPMPKEALLSPRIDSDAVGRVNLQGVGGSVGAFCQRQETGVIY